MLPPPRAVKGRPERISSLARRSPTARARFWVPPAPGMIPSVTSVNAKRARACGIDEIRRRGDLAAAAIGRAVDGREQRDRAAHHRPHHAFEDQVLRPPAFVGHAVALLEIAAGAKRLVAAAGDDHGAQIFQIDRERFEQLHEIEPHARVQRVRHLGPIERDHEDVIVVAGNHDRLEIGAHPILPSRPGRIFSSHGGIAKRIPPVQAAFGAIRRAVAPDRAWPG